MVVGDKYVVEIETEYGAYASTDGTDISKVPGELYRIKGFNSLVFDNNELDKLEKYEPELTQSDLEKVRQEGREEAWETVRKILTLGSTIQEDIFGCHNGLTVIDSFSASEAIEKIKSYEEQQKKVDDDIKVGDEVIRDEGIKAVVLDFVHDNERIMVYDENGIAEDWCIKEVHKTGRHFPQLQEMFDQMQEG